MTLHPRRDFLKLGAALGLALPAVGVAAAASPAKAAAAPRKVALHNIHTNEMLEAVYWDEGRYVPDAMHAVSHVLRDYRTGDVHPIEPRLLDLLDTLSGHVQTRTPFQVISGYRSPRTNALLHARSHGVAEHSLHMKGMAIDIRLQDVDLAHLHQAALAMKAGGVGYYPSSNFVHVDVGPVRRWG